MKPGSNLNKRDIETFARSGIPPELLERAQVQRVTDKQARAVFGFNGSGDLSGIVFPYRDPLTGVRHTARIRRDNPEVESGAVKGKYRCPYGDRRHLYFVYGCAGLINDITVPVVLHPPSELQKQIKHWEDRKETSE